MFYLPFPGSDLVHGVFVALGLAAGGWVLVHEYRRSAAHDRRIWIVAAFCVIFAALGERLGTWFQHVDFSQNLSLIEQWLRGNRSILAALTGAWLGVHFGKWVSGYRLRTGDLFAPAVALGMAIGRIGCFLTELPGTPTGGPWGVLVPADWCAVWGCVPGVPLHPSLLYETIFHAAAFVILWRFRGRWPGPGDSFIGYVAAYGVFRFLVEFVRGNRLFWGPFSGPQLFLAVTVPVLLWRIAVILRRVWRRA